MKVLVVEDNEDSRNLLIKQLRAHGQEVIAATNGVQALEQALKHCPDIIVSDIMMPVMDGFRLCRECKQNEQLKSIPFVFYTATYLSNEDEKFAMSLGANGFIPKPIDIDSFIKIIDEVFKKVTTSPLKSAEVVPVELSLYLSEYNKIIVAKLEQKVVDLEQEITARKRAERDLKAITSRQEAILAANPDIIMEVDTNKVYTWANRSGREFFGEDVIGKEAAFYFEGEQETYDKVQPLFDGDENTIYVESWQRRRDGQKRLLAWWCRTLKGEVGNVVGALSTARDITERKQLEQERQRIAKLESVGILAAGIAHDFNNILTAILGNISLASMKTQPGVEIHDILKEAEKASLRAKDLTQQLLTFSRGGAPIKKLASISELLRDTANFVLRGSNIKCQFFIPDDLWHVDIDEGQISQVINNLVINAQQAMPTGGTIELRVENMTLTEQQSPGKILPLREGKYIRVAVTDQGIGVSQEHLDKIFDPFFTTKHKGSGLGLSTSFSIVHNHGGHIAVDSKLGTGSTFYVYLPASAEKVTPKQERKQETIPVGKARILVMDDEDSVRDVAARMLKHIGYEDVECAADGAEAIKLYKEALKSGKPFTAVILDLTIPGGMGGKEVIKKLLEINPEVKAIVSSGYSSESNIAEYKENGFSSMVAKPYTIVHLRQTLHDLIG